MHCNLCWEHNSVLRKIIDFAKPFVDVSIAEIEPAMAMVEGVDTPIWLLTSTCPSWIDPRFSAEDLRIDGKTCWQNLTEKNLYAVRLQDEG